MSERARVGGPLLLAVISLLIWSLGCRRDVELTAPAPDPGVGCASNGISCTAGAGCCSGNCVAGRCAEVEICRNEGDPCVRSDECCSLVCGQNPAGTGTLVCQNAAGCASTGQRCARAGACCSLACEGSGPVCAEGICATVGESCVTGRDCCGGACEDGVCGDLLTACFPAGETCFVDEQCCGGLCNVRAGPGPGPGGPGGPPGPLLGRCELLPFCRVSGETCTSAADCCSGICVNSPATGVMLCSEGDHCRVALDACTSDGDCCSGQCGIGIDGSFRCQFIDGCRPAGERCAADANCCSHACQVGADGVARCDGKVGSVGGGSVGGTADCRPTGELCQNAADCCAGGREACRDDGSGALRCLLADPGGLTCPGIGQPCAVSQQCCGAWCVPNGLGTLLCRVSCSPQGAPCSADVDCCEGGTCAGPPGKTSCMLLDHTLDAGLCISGGRACDPLNNDCCIGNRCGLSAAGTYVCGW